jgi:hypothetical protein
MPENLYCAHGISARMRPIVTGASSLLTARVDCRDNTSLTLARDRATLQDSKDTTVQRRVDSRCEDILKEHLKSTSRGSGSDDWAYKQRLIDHSSHLDFWNSYPQTIRLYQHGETTLVALADIMTMPVLGTTVLPSTLHDPYSWLNLKHATEATDFIWDSVIPCISESDVRLLSSAHRKSIFETRHAENVRWLPNGQLAIDWHAGDKHRIGSGYEHRDYELVPFPLTDHVAYPIHPCGTDMPVGIDTYFLINSSHLLVKWILSIHDASKSQQEITLVQFNGLWSIFSELTRYPTSKRMQNLASYISEWRKLTNISKGLMPPEIELNEEMFGITIYPRRSEVSEDE